MQTVFELGIDCWQTALAIKSSCEGKYFAPLSRCSLRVLQEQLVEPKLYSKLGKLLTILALGVETRQTHLVIESSNYDGYFGSIRCPLCVLRGKFIVPNNGVFCEDVSCWRCRSQPYVPSFWVFSMATRIRMLRMFLATFSMWIDR